MIVIDASVGIDLFIRSDAAVAIRNRIDRAGRAMAAPEVFDLEILQTLRRFERNRLITPERSARALDVFRHAPIERYTHRLLAARIWALRENLTAYDAAYFALSEALEAPLWTRDAKFAGVPGHGAQVEIL
ncbi:MAG: type II toxin-antitoxin system VapC family toxin [Oceanicaulis sp.]